MLYTKNKDGIVLVEPILVKLSIKGAKFKVTPLAPDMTAKSKGTIFETKDNNSTWLGRLLAGDNRKTLINVGDDTPSIWYYIEKL